MVVIGAHVLGYLSIGKPPVAVGRGKEGPEHIEDSGLKDNDQLLVTL